VELRRYLMMVRRRWLLVTITVLAGLAAGYITTPKGSVYTAQSTIYVGARQLSPSGVGNGFVSADLLLGMEAVIKTYAVMIDSQPIAAEAVKRAGIQRSADGVVASTTAAQEPNTQLLLVSVRDPDPAAAQQLANSLADVFVEKIETFEPSAAPQPGAIPQLPAYVFERASLPTVPASNGATRRMFLGLLFGLTAAIGLVSLLEYLDITIKSASDAERRIELPVLGVIPFDRPTARGRRAEQRRLVAR